MKLSILLIMSCLLIPLYSVVSQECYNSEDGACCFCDFRWNCGLTDFSCPRTTTTGFRQITIYTTTTEKIVVITQSNDLGFVALIAVGVAFGIVLSIAMLFCICCPSRIREIHGLLFRPLATRGPIVHYYRRDCSKDVELGSSNVSIYFDAVESHM